MLCSWYRARNDETPSMPADTPPVQDHELPSGLARGAPLFGKDRSDAVVLLFRTRQTRLFFQIAPCLAPRNLLLPVKSHGVAPLFPKARHFLRLRAIALALR